MMKNIEERRRKELDAIIDASTSARYLMEKEMSLAIKDGNVEKVAELMKEWTADKECFHDVPLTGENELFLYKNQLEHMNTYSRLAAMSGELLPYQSYILSMQNSILIDRSNSISFLKEKIFDKMCAEYSQAVRNFSTKNYSDTMKEIVQYISEHLVEELTLSNLAERYHMHPVHLARKFKQETKLTFIEYVNIMRTNLSKYFFHLDKYSLSEVAYLSGFNSHSYFTKVFKKNTGQTPTLYIKNLYKGIRV